MYLTVKQQLKDLPKSDYRTLRTLSHVAKNLANQAIYNIRQYYFMEHEYLRYEKNYSLLKDSVNYKLLNSNMAQQILKEVDSSFKSFFGLLKLAKKGKYSFKDCRLPSYYKKDGFVTLVIGFVRIKDNKLVLPVSRTFSKNHKPVVINLPPILYDKHIKEIRIIPKYDARFFEIQYTYECECIQRNLNKQNALALDLGVNNLVTAVSTSGDSFIIDGKRLKSYNQWFNKENSRLQSLNAKQHVDIRHRTVRQKNLSDKHHARVNDYMSKSAKMLINYCLNHDIGNIVCGYNETFQRNSSMGKRNNQNFVNISFGQFRDKLEYLCALNGINFVKQEESYTSQASFWDKDVIPVYNCDNVQTYKFSGKRQHRGLYITKKGKKLNADVNGALNILKKSNVVSLSTLYSRGDVNTPIRIRVS